MGTGYFCLKTEEIGGIKEPWFTVVVKFSCSDVGSSLVSSQDPGASLWVFGFAVWALVSPWVTFLIQKGSECILQFHYPSLLSLSIELGDPTACFNFALTFYPVFSIQAGRILTETSWAPCKCYWCWFNSTKVRTETFLDKPSPLRLVFTSLRDRAFKLTRDPAWWRGSGKHTLPLCDWAGCGITTFYLSLSVKPSYSHTLEAMALLAVPIIWSFRRCHFSKFYLLNLKTLTVFLIYFCLINMCGGLHVWASHVYVVPVEIRRQCQILWN